MSLIKKIKDYYKKGFDNRNTLFTTPTHEQGKFVTKNAKDLLGEKFFKCDFSEIEGFDNLRSPDGVLKAVLDKFSKIYQSKQTYILTNGSTSGVIAMMMSVVNEGDKVLISRNCHVSVYNALVVTGAVPIWFMPEYDQEWGIYKGISKELISKNLKENSDIKAVILTSPTYEGLFSDIEGISYICKEYGVKLLVDEAHGALLNFGNFKTKPAILCGADMSVQSLHKTAGAPNPCALLHIAQNSEIRQEKVQKCLNIINTTSPSYPLILACEICVDFLNSSKGRISLEKLHSSVNKFKKSLPANVCIYDDFNDPTKLLIKINGMSAIDASEILNQKYCIEEEFSTDKTMLFICGIGTGDKKIKKLSSVIHLIAGLANSANELYIRNDYHVPVMKYTPREAFNKESIEVSLNDCIGKIAAETLFDYPPGVPFVVAGELIDKSIIKYIKQPFIKVCK